MPDDFLNDDFLNSVFQNCNALWAVHNSFDHAQEGGRWVAFHDMVMTATYRKGELLHAASKLGIDLTSFCIWLVSIQKAHEQAGLTCGQVEKDADDSWPSVWAAIERLRAAAGVAVERAAAKPADAGPAKAQRRGRLKKDDSDTKRVKLLATLRACPDLRDNLLELGNRVGVSESTARRWMKDENKQYHQSKADKPA